MDNLRRVIKTLFCESNVEDILRSLQGVTRKSSFASDVTSDWMIDVLDSKQTGYTRDEIRYISNVTNDSWLRLPNSDKKRKSVFFSLLHFVDKVLTEEDEEPICRFAHLLRWRELSYLMGEDIFTTAYLAYKDLNINRGRNYFSWRMIINNDNMALRDLLAKGTSELHFHLWGSAFVGEVNWISLMNDVTDRGKQFKELKSAKMPRTVYGFSGNTPLPLHARCIKAATLRLYLFLKINNIQLGEDDLFIDRIINARSSGEVLIYIDELQTKLSVVRYEYGHLFDSDVLDYTIPKNLTRRDDEKLQKSNLILAGERQFLYEAFKYCFKSSDIESKFCADPEFETYFYAYLIIKNDLWKELIQVNDRIGFDNFADYQNRKESFIKSGSIYEKIMGPSAILSTMYDQEVEYLEARIGPKNTTRELVSAIKGNDKKVNSDLFKTSVAGKKCSICDKRKECKEKPKEFNPEYYYILHFIKTDYGEKKVRDEFVLSRKPRCWKLRTHVKTQAMAFNELRKSSSSRKERIVAVDAANTEIGYRPELFAQAFRFLKEFSYHSPLEYIKECRFDKIGFTFHAGEDFLDLADGLRAIDETIKFLNFGSGDRLGHALALGLDAEQYYQLKNNTLILPKQDYLDNIVWVLKKNQEYDITCSSTLVSNLKSEYRRVYAEIYNDTAIDLDIYYQAWLLRGDDPMLYYNPGSNSNTQGNNKQIGKEIAFSFWERCGVNRFEREMDTARKNIKVQEAIHNYHFNVEAKLRGQESDEFEIFDGYSKLVSVIQHNLRHELAKRHIAIECNPTSNQVISSYKRYANHPMLKFNNHRLYHDPSKCEANPQLSISLNTDDQGVFSTLLENEYALMAIALEKEVDEKGNRVYTNRFIYDYLEHIRQMGHEQRFKKRNEKNLTHYRSQ